MYTRLKSMVTWLPATSANWRVLSAHSLHPLTRLYFPSKCSAFLSIHFLGSACNSSSLKKKFSYETCPKNVCYIFFPQPMLIPFLLHVCSGPQGAGLRLFPCGFPAPGGPGRICGSGRPCWPQAQISSKALRFFPFGLSESWAEERPCRARWDTTTKPCRGFRLSGAVHFAILHTPWYLLIRVCLLQIAGHVPVIAMWLQGCWSALYTKLPNILK